MIYGLQIYTDHPGRVPAHVDRFREHTCKMLEKQGIKVIGCWTTADENHKDGLIFMIAHDTLEELRSAQRRFRDDPERIAMVEESEKDGLIILSSDNWVLKPTDFSPLQ